MKLIWTLLKSKLGPIIFCGSPRRTNIKIVLQHLSVKLTYTTTFIINATISSTLDTRTQWKDSNVYPERTKASPSFNCQVFILITVFLCLGDSRFSCLHSSQSDTWTLQIRYTQLRDMGEYQCQVNTEPKISMSVFLHVTGINPIRNISLAHLLPLAGDFLLNPVWANWTPTPHKSAIGKKDPHLNQTFIHFRDALTVVFLNFRSTQCDRKIDVFQARTTTMYLKLSVEHILEKLNYSHFFY